MQLRESEREQIFNELEQQYYRGFEDGQKSTIRCLYGIKECRPEDLNTVIDELMQLIEGRKEN